MRVTDTVPCGFRTVRSVAYRDTERAVFNRLCYRFADNGVLFDVLYGIEFYHVDTAVVKAVSDSGFFTEQKFRASLFSEQTESIIGYNYVSFRYAEFLK